MRRLVVFRHAKAVGHDETPDHERALTARGRRDAATMGRYLASEGLRPDLVLVSTSLRTRETWDEAAPALGPAEPRLDRALYLAPPNLLLALVQALPDEVSSAMIIGHNPGLEELASLLAGFGDRYARARLRDKFPTSAVAVLDLPGEHWAGAGPGAARLDRFVVPADVEPD
jgi:phosphohistidine phosphatase